MEKLVDILVGVLLVCAMALAIAVTLTFCVGFWMFISFLLGLK